MWKQCWRAMIMVVVGFILAGCGSAGAGIDAGPSGSNRSPISAEEDRLDAEKAFTVRIENDSAVITGYTGNAKDLVIPSTIQGKTVSAIADRVFMDKQLTSVVIPDSVVTIGTNVFTRNRLTGIVIPGSVTVIGDRAFSDNKLVSAVVPGSIVTIGDNVFSGNPLTSLEMPPDGVLAEKYRTAWEETRENDKVDGYKKFITGYPGSEHIEAARERMEWQKTNRAEVTIEYSKEIRGRISPYSNVSSPFFQWKATFREAGGKTGFKVVGGRKYIRDSKGNYWVSSNNRYSQYDDVSADFDHVKPNGSGTTSSWLSGKSFIGATVTLEWTIEDDFGNSEKLTQEMKLVE